MNDSKEFRYRVRSVETNAVMNVFKTLTDAKKEIVRLQTIQYRNKLKIISYEIFDTKLEKVVYESDRYHLKEEI